MEDGEVLFGLEAIAGELSRITGKEIDEKTAGYWARRGIYRTRKRGHFVTATKSSLAKDFQPEPDAAA
jgi:hypothetical protein